MKTTYYTKCGKVAFEKSSSAAVTRFEGVNEHCGQCPFIQTTTTTRKGKNVTITYCQAGSVKPNNKTEYHTCNESDATTLDILSLDWDKLKEIYTYASSLKGCTSGATAFENSFHAIDRPDCRKSLPIYFENNKKGRAAKKAIIEKYFMAQKEEEESTADHCEDCMHSIEDEESLAWIKCSKRHSFVTKKQSACDRFEPRTADYCEDCAFSVDEDESEGYMHCLKKSLYPYVFKKQEACNKFESRKTSEEVKELNCKIKKCSFNNEELSCCGFDTSDVNNSMFTELAQDAIKLGCKNKNLKDAFHNEPCKVKDHKNTKVEEEQEDQEDQIDITEILDTEENEKISNEPTEEEEILQIISESEKCISKNKECKYYCSHNAGCSLLLAKKSIIPAIIKQCGDAACQIYINALVDIDKKDEIVESIESDQVSNSVQSFDYSVVDNDTAVFLQEKATKITEIRIKSVVAIGKELKEAHERLANNKTGTFQSWVESLGISPKTAYNYINGFDYIVKNFHSIEDAKDIQPSLLFAVSKSSAPEELQEKVIAGEIKTHKDWKEELAAYEEKIKKLENENYKAHEALGHSQNENNISKITIESLRNTVTDLEQKLSEVSDTGEVERLQSELENAKNRVKELESRPIEVGVQEVIPEDVQNELQHLRNKNQENADYNLVSTLIAGFNALHFGQLKNYAKVLKSNNSQTGIERVEDMIRDFRIKFESIADYLEETEEPEVINWCSQCQYTDPDQVSDEDLDDDKVYCTVLCETVGINDKACLKFTHIKHI